MVLDDGLDSKVGSVFQIHSIIREKKQERRRTWKKVNQHVRGEVYRGNHLKGRMAKVSNRIISIILASAEWDTG